MTKPRCFNRPDFEKNLMVPAGLVREGFSVKQ